MERRADCTGASSCAYGSDQSFRYTQTQPGEDPIAGDGGGGLDALLAELEAALRAGQGEPTKGRRRPRGLREVRALLDGLRDGTILVERTQAREDAPGSRRRGKWADEGSVKNRPAWGKLRVQTAMSRHFRICGLGTPARLVWWHLWSRGGGVLTDASGRSIVEVGMVHAAWIAEETGLGERTVRRAFVELEEAGMIARKRTFRGFKYRVVVPAGLLADIAGMTGQSDPSGQDMSLASGQMMPVPSGQRVSLDTPESTPEPPTGVSGGDWECGAATGAGSEEPPRGGMGSEGVSPIALRRSLLVTAGGVWPSQADALVRLPVVAAMPLEDLRAEIQLAHEDGDNPGALLVARLRKRDKTARSDRGAKRTKGTTAGDELVETGGASWPWASASDAKRWATACTTWMQAVEGDEGSTCWRFIGDTVQLAYLGLDENGTSAGFREQVAEQTADFAGDPPPEEFVDHACRIVEADRDAFETIAKHWRDRIDEARQASRSNPAGSPEREESGRRLILLTREAATAFGDWFRSRWSKPAAPRRREAEQTQVVETPAPAPPKHRCPSDVKPSKFELAVHPIVAQREESEAKAAGTWTRFSMPRRIEVQIKPGQDLAALAIEIADQEPDPAAVSSRISKCRDSARMDQHERRVVLTALELVQAELARRRREAPPTQNPVEVLRAMQAAIEAPVARIEAGEIVETKTQTPAAPAKRSRSRSKTA